jgi:hypothetical protein
MKSSTPFRIVLWLLLMVLPAHAIAATSMGHCVRMGRVVVSDAVGIQQVKEAEQISTTDEAMPDCHGAMVKKAGTAVDASADSDSDTKLTKLSKVFKATGKCSACESCCYAVAAVGGIVAQTFAIPNQTTKFYFATSAITFITGGLERPPKHLNL